MKLKPKLSDLIITVVTLVAVFAAFTMAKAASGTCEYPYPYPYPFGDNIIPTVDIFTAASPTLSNSLNISVTAFTALDDFCVAGYLITESSTPPSVDAGGWSATEPSTYTVGSVGTYTLYPWAKDAAGNVSAVFATPRKVVVPAIRGSQRNNDGWILNSSPVQLNRTAQTLRLGDNADNNQYLAVLSFNTKLPAGAVITKVVLKFNQQGVFGKPISTSTFGGFMVDIKKGMFGSKPGLQLGDFYATPNKTMGKYPLSPSSTNWYALNLTPGKGFINKLGLTQLRLRFFNGSDYNDKARFLKIYSGNADDPTLRPQLVITVSMP
jgi:hypothetical protein